MQAKIPKRVVAAIPDLFFSSKVLGPARRLGIEVRIAASPQALLDGASEGPDLVIVDLEAAAVNPLESIRSIRSMHGGRPRLVAFANHVREDLLSAARDAGCEEVLGRGALAAGLPRLLASL